MPDPDGAGDLAEFIGLLGDLRTWAGMPSYRVLAKRVGSLVRPAREIPLSTVVDTFKAGRRRLDLDLVVAVVRALGTDEPTVDRWREACIKVHGLAKVGGPAGVFRQLPANLATFTGRDHELRTLLDAVNTSSGPVSTVVISAIEGMGGVGKTALAVHVAHRLVASGRFAETQLYVNLRGFDEEHAPVDPADALAAFLRQLGVPAQKVPDGVDERAAMYRDRMAGRQALVLLDDAVDERQVRDLIPAGPTCLVLITSRRSLAALDGAALVPLDVFTHDEATALLARIVGVERVAAEPEATAEIVELCGCLPLAVALAGGRLRSRPAWGLAHLADRLRGHVVDASELGSRSLRRVFGVSYRGLPAKAQRVFRLLGRHPGVDYTLLAVAAMADLAARDTEMLLELLQDEYLLQQRTPGRYELHDLLRSFAAQASGPENNAEGDAAVERLGWWFLHSAYNAAKAIDTPDLPAPTRLAEHAPTTFDSYDEALAWFGREWENLIAVQHALRDLGLHEIVWQLGVAQKFAAGLRYRLADSVTAHELAVDAARALGDRAVEARVTGGLGLACYNAGRPDDAERHLRTAQAILRELGDWVRMGPLLLNLGLVHEARKDYQQAMATFLESLEVFEKSGAIGGRGVARAKLGNVYQELGDLDRAEHYYLLSLEDSRTVNAAARADSTKVGDRRGQVERLGSLASVFLARGEAERAVQGYRETAELARVVGDRYLLAEAAHSLGDALLAVGEKEQARDAWTEALALFEDLGHERATAVRQRLLGIDDP
ncbi:tetratricopeptide repeat protein [Kitasatospora sp. NBC_01287]|uniref:ATP-binding protein n=1 Tax=Kitasatospora sp. NBC_01287 TaxID=2903573 RepID=UPI00225BA24B|nr:tetratricopeptide repeat protein [Kitasatospora sp. NBC_01287]MCX4751016.1 tetratricopeptide repeat protein [Kitasatospora sp. NBC_01287]